MATVCLLADDKCKDVILYPTYEKGIECASSFGMPFIISDNGTHELWDINVLGKWQRKVDFVIGG